MITRSDSARCCRLLFPTKLNISISNTGVRCCLAHFFRTNQQLFLCHRHGASQPPFSCLWFLSTTTIATMMTTMNKKDTPTKRSQPLLLLVVLTVLQFLAFSPLPSYGQTTHHGVRNSIRHLQEEEEEDGVETPVMMKKRKGKKDKGMIGKRKMKGKKGKKMGDKMSKKMSKKMGKKDNDEGGNDPDCPEELPSTGDLCVGDLFCVYGEESCCGETFASYGVSRFIVLPYCSASFASAFVHPRSSACCGLSIVPLRIPSSSPMPCVIPHAVVSVVLLRFVLLRFVLVIWDSATVWMAPLVVLLPTLASSLCAMIHKV